jgi:hypothetical protein
MHVCLDICAFIPVREKQIVGGREGTTDPLGKLRWRHLVRKEIGDSAAVIPGRFLTGLGFTPTTAGRESTALGAS